MRWRCVALAAALLAAGAADAHLVVEAGPAALVGLELKAPPFAFSRAFPDGLLSLLRGGSGEAAEDELAAAVVRGEVAITLPEDWSYRTCPPTYVGPASFSLRGRLVVHVDVNQARCSFEQHARGAGALGARAWLPFLAIGTRRRREPGFCTNCWLEGDSRWLPAPLAADISQPAALALVDALRAQRNGTAAAGAPIRAALTPSRSAWRAMWAHPLWHGSLALLGLQTLATFELALCRLLAFVRADRGPRASIAQLMLLLQAAVAAGRLALFADPLLSRGLYSTRAAIVLNTAHISVGALSTALFLAFFADAAASAGVASLAFGSRGAVRALRLFAACTLALEAGLSSVFFFTLSVPTMIAKIVLSTTLLPFILLLISVGVLLRLRARTSQLPAALVSRLTRRLGETTLLSALALCASAGFLWTLYAPVGQALCFMAYSATLCAASYTQTAAFIPVGAPLTEGPLRRGWRRAAAALGGAARACHGRCHATVHPASAVPPSSPRRLSRAASSVLPLNLHLGVRPSVCRELCAAFQLGPATTTAEVGALIGKLTRGGEQSLAQLVLEHGGLAPVIAAARTGHALPRTAAPIDAEQRPVHRIGSGSSLLLGGSFGGGNSHALRRAARGSGSSDGSWRRMPLPSMGAREAAPMTDAAPANLFISHAQSCSFVKMLDAIDAHLARAAPPRGAGKMAAAASSPADYIWLDVISLRQAAATLGGDVRHIAGIEELCGTTLVVLDPWDQPVCLTRAWCLLEIAQAYAHRAVGLEITMAPAEREALVRALATDRGRLERALLRFDARNADASVEHDRRLIADFIEREFERRGDAGDADADEGATGAGHGVVQTAVAAAAAAVGVTATRRRAEAYETFNDVVRRALFSALAASSWQVADGDAWRPSP